MLFIKVFENISAQPTIKKKLAVSAAPLIKANNQEVVFLKLDYEKLNIRANQLATYLLQNYGKKNLVGIFLEPSIEAIITLLAIMKAGFAYTPLKIDNSLSRLEQCVQTCQPVVVITHPIYTDHPFIQSAKRHSIAIDFSHNYELKIHQKNGSIIDLENYPTANLTTDLNADDLAYILYTSGSTGKPKGVEILQRGLFNCLLGHQELLQITPADHISHQATLDFDASLVEIMMALGTGASLHIVPPDIRLLYNQLQEFYVKQQITIATLVPSVMRQLDPDQAVNLRCVISTGEAITNDLVRRWYSEKRNVVNGYGPSEVTIATSIGFCYPDQPLHLGECIPGLKRYVLELEPNDLEAPKRVDDGMVGELYIAGEGLARGYTDEQLTKTRFLKIRDPDNPEQIINVFRTRDAVIKQYDSNLNREIYLFNKRLDRGRKVDGVLIYPEEIEEALNSCEQWVKQACVVNLEVTEKHKRSEFVGCIFPKQDQDIEKFDLINFRKFLLSKDLLERFIPARWLILDKLPIISGRGKVDLKTLEEIAKNDANYIRGNDTAELDELELEIASKWKQILGINADIMLRRDDNFIYLGGSSIDVAALLMHLERAYPDVDWSLEDLTHHFTLGHIAKRIRYESNLSIKQLISVSENYQLKDYRSRDCLNGKPVVILIYSLLGDVHSDFKYLIPKLPKDLAVFGIQSSAYSKTNVLCSSLNELARTYNKLVDFLKSDDGIILAGWSYGGLVAQQMAAQRTVIGKKTAVLMIDTETPYSFLPQKRFSFAKFLQHLIVELLVKRNKLSLSHHYMDYNKILNLNLFKGINAESWEMLDESLYWKEIINIEKLKKLPREEQVTSIFNLLRALLNCINSRDYMRYYEVSLAKIETVHMLLLAELEHQLADKIDNTFLIIAEDSIVQAKTAGKANFKTLGWDSKYFTEILVSPGNHFSIVEKGHAFISAVANKIVAIKDKMQETKKPVKELLQWNRDPRKLPRFNAEKYIHRKIQYQELITKLTNSQQSEIVPTICTIVGLSGSGKTEFILDYAHRPPSSHSYKFTIWFQADDVFTLEKDYLALGKALEIINDESSLQASIITVKTYLEQHPGWLLIYDNAPDDMMLYPYLPQARGCILITSQNPNWQSKIELGSLMQEEAVQLLYQTSGRKDEEAKNLVDKLCYHALTISQAGAYIQKHKIITAKYLQRFDRHAKDLLANNELPIGNTHVPVAVTWNMCLKTLHDEPLAIKLLHFCCYLHSTDIPNRLLCEVLLGACDYENINLYEQIRQKLENYSLITVNPDSDTLSIHSLVQTVIKFSITKEQEHEYAQQLIACFDRLFDYQRYYLDESVTWEKNKNISSLYNQLIVHINELSDSYLLIAPEVAHSLLLKLSQYLIEAENNYKAAEISLKRLECLHQCPSLSQNAFIKAELLREKANLAIEFDEYPQAIKDIEEALKYYQTASLKKTDRAFIATLYYKLGNIFYAQAQYDKARENYQQVIILYKDTDKDEVQNPNVAIAWCGIGNILLIQDNYAQAEIAYKQALAIYSTSIKHQEHKNIAIIYSSLGQLYHKQGNNNKALIHYETAQKVYQKIYDSEYHIDIGICFYNLSYVLYQLGRGDEALEKVQTSLRIYKKIYKTFKHIDLVMIMFHLGFLLCSKEQYAEGVKKYQRAFTIYDKSAQDENESNQLKNLRNYAAFYYQNKEFEKASICYQLLLKCKYTSLKQKGSRVIQMKLEKSSNTYSSNTNLKADYRQLIDACSQGHIERVKKLCAKISDINQINLEGITPLDAAAKNRQLEVVKYLIETGKVELKYKSTNKTETSLLAACQGGNFDILDYLIDAKFDLKKKNENVSNNPKAKKIKLSESEESKLIVWEYDHSYRLGHELGAMKQSYINEVIGKVVEDFFSDDIEVKQQAIESLLSFDRKLLSGLYYLKNRSDRKITNEAIDEIIITLSTIDADVLWSLLENTFSSDYKDKSHEATHFLQLFGLDNEFLKFIKGKSSLKKDHEGMADFINVIIKESFIFNFISPELLKLTSLKEEDSVKKSSNFDSRFFGFLNLQPKSKKKVYIPAALYTLVEEINIIVKLVAQKKLDIKQLTQIVQYFSHPYATIRFVAKNALLYLKLLNTNVVQQTLIDTCSNVDWRIRRDGIVLLAECIEFNKNILSNIAQALDDKAPAVRHVAAIALVKANIINKKIEQVLTENILDENWKIRLSSIRTVLKISKFDTGIIDNITSCLANSDHDVKCAAITALETIGEVKRDDVLNAIVQRFLKHGVDKIKKSVVTVLMKLCNAEDAQIGFCIIDRCRKNDFYRENTRQLEIIFKDSKALFQLLINDSSWFSVRSIAKAITILPSFKEQLFEMIINKADNFPLFIDTVEDISKLCEIFYEYRKLLLELFEKFIVDSPKFFSCLSKDTLHELNELVKKLPELRAKFSKKTVEQPAWLSTYVKDTSDLLKLIKIYPDQLEQLFEQFLANPVWFALSVNSCYVVRNLAKIFTKHLDFLYAKTVEDSEWYRINIKDPNDLDYLVEAFPQCADKLFAMTVADHAWLSSAAITPTHLEKLSQNFPEYKDKLFEITVRNLDWFTSYIKDIKDLTTLTVIFSNPKYKSYLCIKILENFNWFLRAIKINELQIINNFSEQRLELLGNLLEDPDWPVTTLKNNADLLDLLQKFPADRLYISEKLIRNSEFFSAWVESTYGLELLIKDFPTKKTEILERAVEYCIQLSPTLNNNIELKDLMNKYPEFQIDLFGVLVEKAICSASPAEAIHDLKNFMTLFPKQQAQLSDKLVSIISKNSASFKSEEEEERNQKKMKVMK